MESAENADLAKKFSVSSVPQTVVNGNIVAVSLQPEDVFVDGLISGAPVELRKVVSTGEVIKKDVVIVGAGPAGLTAAIYTARSGMDTIVLDKANIGGQVAITPVVENYPGYTSIPGKTLTDMMAQQASQYTDIHQGEEVLEVNNTGEGLYRIKTTSSQYETKVIIVATGAEHTKLDVPGETRFFGRGVSYCATCDGYFFKDDKKVIMVGGGNTAATEALYLESIGVDVTIVHRKDKLRAEERLQKNIEERGIPVIWDTVVEEISGENVVTSVKLRNLKDSKVSDMAVDGVFVAIGYDPVNELAKKIGLDLTDEGYIKVDEGLRTSLPGVYAAGDITGGIKQIVTAVGQGSVAAINAFEDMMKPYWKEK